MGRYILYPIILKRAFTTVVKISMGAKRFDYTSCYVHEQIFWYLCDRLGIIGIDTLPPSTCAADDFTVGASEY